MSKHPSKGLRGPLWVSQNFLTSSAVIHSALCKTNLGKNDHVIEIGPGKGHITKALARHSAQVTAVELDDALFGKSRYTFAEAPNVRLVQGDFLQFPLPKNGNYKVFSNIPFSITTAILHKLTGCANPPQNAWLTMEKGAARRFAGIPSESLHSLMLKPFFGKYHFSLPARPLPPKARLRCCAAATKSQNTAGYPR